MKVLKFFSEWDATTYEKEFTETGSGLSTELSSQSLTSIDYNKFEARRLKCTFFDDGWFEQNVKRGDVALDKAGAKTVYSTYKVRLFDDAQVLFTGYVDVTNSPKNRTTTIVNMTAKSPIARMQDGIKASSISLEQETVLNKILVSDLLKLALEASIYQSGMSGSPLIDYADRYNLNLEYNIPYDVQDLLLSPLPFIESDPALLEGFEGSTQTPYSFVTAPAVINSQGFRLDTDGIIRFYWSYTRWEDNSAYGEPLSVNETRGVSRYMVVELAGLTTATSYFGSGAVSSGIDNPYIEDLGITTDTGFSTIFPTLDNIIYEETDYSYKQADKNLYANGLIPAEYILLDESRLEETGIIQVEDEEETQTEERLIATYTCTEIFDLCRVLLLAKVYTDEDGMIQISNIPNSTEVTITDASGTEDIGVLHTKIDYPEVLAILKYDNIIPIGEAMNKKFSEAYSTPAIKTKTFNSGVKIDGKAIIDGVTYHVNKVTPDKRNIIFEIEGWEYGE